MRLVTEVPPGMGYTWLADVRFGSAPVHTRPCHAMANSHVDRAPTPTTCHRDVYHREDMAGRQHRRWQKLHTKIARHPNTHTNSNVQQARMRHDHPAAKSNTSVTGQ